MVARRTSKKAWGGENVRDAREQEREDRIVENMLLTEADKSEKAWIDGPRGGRIHKPEKGVRHGGRQKGTPNALTRIAKDATIEALARIGFDGHGKDGLVGWIMRLALRHPMAAANLLGRIIPTQISVKTTSTEQFLIQTQEQVISEMRKRNLPLEHLALFQITKHASKVKEINPGVGANGHAKPRRAPIVIEQD